MARTGPAAAAASTDPRIRVIDRLAARIGSFPDLPIASLDPAGLEPRDAAFARALDLAISRRWLTLVALAEPHVDRGWARLQDPLKAAILAGTAQLFLLDRIPDHAAVGASVEWAKRTAGDGAGGLVNAVLRRIAESRVELLPADHADARTAVGRVDLVPLSDGRAWRLAKPTFADETVAMLSAQTSHAKELVVHWIGAHGREKTRDICHHDLCEAPTLVTGLGDDARARHADRIVPHSRPGWWCWNGSAAELSEVLAGDPGARVQDPGSAEPVLAVKVAGLEPKVIVDLCAGRGTKTRQLAAAFPSAEVIATDIDAARRRDLAALGREHERSGGRIRAVDPGEVTGWFGKADLVVLDVPCTNTGVLPRRPEARYRFTRARLDSLLELQREIAAGALPLLSPRGAVLYSTCSLEPAENARQAEWLRRRGGLAPVAERQRFPEGHPGDPASSYVDGGFHSVASRG